MSYEFTVDEIREAVSAARIYSPGYTEEQFQASRELGRRLGESGYLEAVHSVARWEKEKETPCTEVLDAVGQLLSRKEQLEAEVAIFEEKLARRQQETQQAEETLGQVETATEQAKEEKQKEEEELGAFRRRANKEKQAIEKELEQCRQEANVTKEETATAGQLKAEVEEYGFNLDLALGLSREFKGYEDIRDKLAEGLKRGLTLTEYNNQAEERRQSLETDVKSLKGERWQVVSNLSQLRADTAFEEKIRQFYRRYQSAGWFMEQLASWRGIFFVRCGNPTYAATSVLNRSTRGARFWTEKPPVRRCPCCDYPSAFYDEEVYQALNWEPGAPFQLKLGE